MAKPLPVERQRECERLLRLGWSQTEIHQQTGIVPSTVDRYRHKPSITGRVETPAATMAEARRLAAAGDEAQAIADKTGCPPARIAAIQLELARKPLKDSVRRNARPLPFGLFIDSAGNKLFVPPPAVVKARDHADVKGRGGAVNIGQWVRKFRDDCPWFLDWWRGGNAAVEVLSASAVDRLVAAWDVTALMQQEPRLPRVTYDKGLKTFPDRGFAHFAAWLFGCGQPAGWYIVAAKLFALKQELTPHRRRIAAKVSCQSTAAWQRSPSKKQSLADAIDAARKGGNDPSPDSPFWSIDARTRASMQRLAKASTMESCLARAGLTAADWKARRDAAERIGGEQLAAALDDYVHGRQPPTAGKQSDKRGVVWPGLYVPMDWMEAFRTKALALKRAQRLAELEPKATKAKGRTMASPELFLRLLLSFTLPNGAPSKRLNDPETFADPRPEQPEGKGIEQAQPMADLFFNGKVPDNEYVLKVVAALESHRTKLKRKEVSCNHVAVSACGGDVGIAASTLATIRRYRRNARDERGEVRLNLPWLDEV